MIVRNPFDSLMPLPQRIEKRAGIFRFSKTFRVFRNEPSRGVESLLERLAYENHLRMEMTTSPEGAQLTLITNPRLPELKIIPAFVRDQGYVLDIGTSGIQVSAAQSQGIYYALQTLWQLMDRSATCPSVRLADWPDLALRGVHIMLGSGLPRLECMKSLLLRLASYKINQVVIEYDDRFPWERYPILVGYGTYSKDGIRDLVALAREHFIEIVPLLDSLGHAEPYLKHPSLAYLRELPHRINEMCPSNPRTLHFIKSLWKEVLELHPNSRYAHISGDEVFRLGDFCPRCKPYARRDLLHVLYAQYYKALSRWIIAQGKTPIVWGDMLIKYPKGLEIFPKDILINDWSYDGVDRSYWPETWGGHCGYVNKDTIKNIPPDILKRFGPYWLRNGNRMQFVPFPYIKMYQDNGFQVIGASAAYSSMHVCYSPLARFVNAKRLAMAIKANNGMGIINTYWGNAGIADLSWHSFVAGADFSWHVRNEEESRFSRRFLKNNLALSESYAFIFPALSKQFEPIAASGYQTSGMNDTSAIDAIVVKADEMKQKGRRNANYLKLLDDACHILRLQTRLESFSRKVTGLILGTGRDVPFSLGDKVNCHFSACMPHNAGPLAMTPGTHEIYDIPFQVIDPAKNGGKSVVRLMENEAIDLGIDKTAAGVYFLWTAYNLLRGTRIGTMRFRFAEHPEQEVPLIGGVQIEDWWNKRLPLKEGFTGWHGKTYGGGDIFVHLFPWKCPYPNDQLRSIRIECGPRTQSRLEHRLIVVAATVRQSQQQINHREAFLQIDGEWRQLKDEERRLRKIVAKDYLGLMGKQDAAQFIQETFRHIDASIQHCGMLISRVWRRLDFLEKTQK